jgi:hypothetical protein
MLVSERTGHAKAEIAGDIGHRRDDQQRIVDRHLHRVFQRRAWRALVDVVNPEHIGEKQRIELAALQYAGQLNQ